MFNSTRKRTVLILAMAAAGSICSGVAQSESLLNGIGANNKAAGVIASSTGGGHFAIGTLDIRFSFSANQRPDGSASGHHRHEVTFQGLPVDFSGEVICVTVDEAEGRAWIGAIITQNRSEHPAFTEARHEPGRDIWFRVLDTGEGNAEPDRSTFVGFEGDAGIITSQEYCDVQPWPDDNARTNPVTEGNIQVRP